MIHFRYCLTIGLILPLAGCSTLARLNLRGQVGGEFAKTSTYSTTLADGELDLKPALGRGFGVGYYGLLKNLNLSLERSVAQTKSKSLDTKVEMASTHFFVEYLFDAQQKSFPYVGLGLGTTATGFSGDEPRDTGHSFVIRGGYMWRVGRAWHLFAQAHYNKVEVAHVNRFYYFGGAGDIRHELIGVSVGAVFNLVKPEKIETASPPPPTP